VQQDHGHAGRLGLAVELVDQRAPDASAALAGFDEHQHEVGGRSGAGHRGDPSRRLWRLSGQHPDGFAVTLGQPGPRRGSGEQAGCLVPQRRQRVRPFVDRAEARVEPDDLESQRGDDISVRDPGAPDQRATVEAQHAAVRCN
jgi:hypothetical protein